MGKFLAGIAVGLISYEIAFFYGFGKKPIENHLPSDKEPCCKQVDNLPKESRSINGVRKMAIV